MHDSTLANIKAGLSICTTLCFMNGLKMLSNLTMTSTPSKVEAVEATKAAVACRIHKFGCNKYGVVSFSNSYSATFCNNCNEVKLAIVFMHRAMTNSSGSDKPCCKSGSSMGEHCQPVNKIHKIYTFHQNQTFFHFDRLKKKMTLPLIIEVYEFCMARPTLSSNLLTTKVID